MKNFRQVNHANQYLSKAFGALLGRLNQKESKEVGFCPNQSALSPYVGTNADFDQFAFRLPFGPSTNHWQFCFGEGAKNREIRSQVDETNFTLKPNYTEFIMLTVKYFDAIWWPNVQLI